MNLEQIYAIPVDGDGWRLLPNGKRVKLGARITWNGEAIDASVGNGASVGDGARVGDGASVGDYASVGNGASVGNDARFDKSPLAVQGTRHLACQSAPGVITIGCCTFSFEHWTTHVLGIAREHGYTKEEGLEYQKIVAFIVSNGIPAAAAPESLETQVTA